VIFDQWATGVDTRTRHSSRRVTPTLILRLDERLNMQNSCFERIAYDKESGVFRWAVSARGISAGKLAGHINAEGYRIIKVGRQAYMAHRLALHHVGLFDDANVAHSAYLAKKRELHAGCTI